MSTKNSKSKKEISVPVDLQRALASSPKANKMWKDITPIARRDWIHWVITAKQRETRKRRIKNACSMLSSGKRRVCCFPGLKWLKKNRPKSINASAN